MSGTRESSAVSALKARSLRRAIELQGGNLTRAATALAINVATARRWVQRYDLAAWLKSCRTASNDSVAATTTAQVQSTEDS